jgi:putative redox protein|tara:strand:+ start:161 stop:571 length:411 start_codon:yes stop_codon:yes gene_type:complete
MKTTIEWQDGVHFVANTESGNKIHMDGPADSGGENNGARPTELLISGMAGCTAFDVISMAKSKSIEILKLNVDIDASRTETKPSLINQIHLNYKISAPKESKEDIEKIIKISVNKQCSCCIVLSKAVNITYSLELN